MSPNLDKTVIWVHGDCLNPNNTAFAMNPDAPAIFVWDEALLNEWQISLKRIVFIYECLLEMPVTIRRGDVAETVSTFAQAHGAGRIVTMESPSPRFREIAKAISLNMPSGSRLEVMKEAPFLDTDRVFDLKRFSRYWRQAKDFVFK